MFDWFESGLKKIDVKVDIHSHLIPGIDDGSRSIEESIELIRKMQTLGFERLITTPHIYPEYYPNTAEIIQKGLVDLKAAMEAEQINMGLEAAAEYFIDPIFIELIDSKEPILSFGKDKYVLIETPFYSKPLIFDEVVFKLKSSGYMPVLAHPERYQYLENDYSWLMDVRERGVKLQVSFPSLGGFYGKQVQRTAKKLFKLGMVDFIGSDIHRKGQIEGLFESVQIPVKNPDLLNNTLL